MMQKERMMMMIAARTENLMRRHRDEAQANTNKNGQLTDT